MIDYTKHFTTRKAIYSELQALHKANRRKDGFILRNLSKRESRLVRMFHALKPNRNH
jgi:hypothetical protein